MKRMLLVVALLATGSQVSAENLCYRLGALVEASYALSNATQKDIDAAVKANIPPYGVGGMARDLIHSIAQSSFDLQKGLAGAGAKIVKVLEKVDLYYSDKPTVGKLTSDDFRDLQSAVDSYSYHHCK